MLALVGSGEYLPDVDPIDRELLDRLGAPPRVVCLATAAGREGDAVIDGWLQKGVSHFGRLGAAATPIRLVTRGDAHDPGHAAAIDAANFVYLSGGDPGYLAETLADTPAWDAIMRVHAGGGVVAGCSAGAMIMGERINGPRGSRDGFNLLPGTTIVPHFDEFPGIVARIVRLMSNRALAVVGIDGRTALVADGDQFEVLGRGRVTVMRQPGKRHFGAGTLPGDWLE